MKQVLRKFLKKTIEPSGTYDGGTIAVAKETIINERIEKELLTKDELQELIDQFEQDDYEEAYNEYGLMLDMNEELCSITLDTLYEGLHSFLENNKGEHPNLEEIENKIEPWRAYDLDFESEKEGEK